MVKFIQLLETSGTLLDALRPKTKKASPRLTPSETPRDRFLMLLHHKEWGPGVGDFVRRNSQLTIPQMIDQVQLKPDLRKWMLSGIFQSELRKKPPTRQEIHDLNYRRDRRKAMLTSMLTQKPREDSK